jgi:hypothetical protein
MFIPDPAFSPSRIPDPDLGSRGQKTTGFRVSDPESGFAALKIIELSVFLVKNQILMRSEHVDQNRSASAMPRNLLCLGVRRAAVGVLRNKLGMFQSSVPFAVSPLLPLGLYAAFVSS